MLAKSYFKITGNSHNGSYFKFHENNIVDFDKLHDVLTGKKLGVIFHDVIPLEVCRAVSNNFWNSEIARERSDGVPAISIGAYHYKKDLEEYFNQIELAKAQVEKLFDGTCNFVESFVNTLIAYFEQRNITVRVARHNEREASKFVMRSCSALSDFVILPHEDVAQCRTKKQKGFEIEKIPNYEMIAVNMCLENYNGGQLHMWNIQPDDEARAELNIEETGYPYPPYLVADFDEIIIPIKAGDIYCFNGRNIHAVKSKSKSEKYRTTITFFMGYIDANTIIYWT